jgi:hypothetical protein
MSGNEPLRINGPRAIAWGGSEYWEELIVVDYNKRKVDGLRYILENGDTSFVWGENIIYHQMAIQLCLVRIIQ